MFISRKWEYASIRQFKLCVLLCILCKCNCRRSSSHCKSVTQFAPQKCVSLITEKFPNEEGDQWPTSVTHFAKVTYLRPPTRLFHSPTLRRLGLGCDRSKPPRGRDVEQSSPRPDWIQNRQAHPGGRSQKLPPEAEQILTIQAEPWWRASIWRSHRKVVIKQCSYHNNIIDIQNRLPYSKVVYPAIIVLFSCLMEVNHGVRTGPDYPFR